MTGYALDTNHASGMLKKNIALLEKTSIAQEQAKLSITIPSIAELWFMVYNSSRIEKNADDLTILLRGLERRDFTEEAAMEFGRMKADLRRKGRPIPDTDVQIAAIARVNDLTVLTADAHFNYISDLRTENWLA